MRVKSSFATSPAPSTFGPLLFAGDVDRALRAASDLGFDGVEISLGSADEIDVEGLAGMLTDRGLELSAVGTGRMFLEDGLSFTHGDASVRTAAVERIRGLIGLGARFDAPVIIGLVRGAVEPSCGDRLVEYDRLIECLRDCAETAGDTGVSLVVEAINRYETVFQNTAEQTMQLIEEVDRPSLGILLDVFHMNIEEVSISQAVRDAGSRLRYAHVADSNRWAPGLGHVDYPPLLDALRSVGYDGWLSAEVLPVPSDAEAAEQIRRFFDALRI